MEQTQASTAKPRLTADLPAVMQETCPEAVQPRMQVILHGAAFPAIRDKEDRTIPAAMVRTPLVVPIREILPVAITNSTSHVVAREWKTAVDVADFRVTTPRIFRRTATRAARGSRPPTPELGWI
jgi:hypothetical protein